MLPLAMVATRENPPPHVVERVRVDDAAAFDADEEETRAVVRILRWVIRVRLGLVEEALADQERVGDPGDGLEPEVRADHREIRGQVPILRRAELASRRGRIEAQYAQAAHGARVVVALSRHVDRRRARLAERHAFRVDVVEAGRVVEGLARAPAVHRIRRPDRAVEDQAIERAGAVAHRPEHRG